MSTFGPPTYSNSYFPVFTTSYTNAHPKEALEDHIYVYTITLILISAYLYDNPIFNN